MIGFPGRDDANALGASDGLSPHDHQNSQRGTHAEHDVARLIGDVVIDSGQGVRVEQHRARFLECDPVMVDRVKPSFFGVKVEVNA